MTGAHSDDIPFSKTYASLYDVVYADKDYRADALRVRGILEQLAPRARRILELGTGTGGHAAHLSEWYEIVGLERSAPMLAIARSKLARKPVHLVHADIGRTPSFGSGFDAAFSLFHVLNYLKDTSLEAVLRRVARSLAPGGVFVFDSWNGSAVIREQPAYREHTYDRPPIHFVRKVRPTLDWVRSKVTLEITIEQDTPKGRELRGHEVHEMRYYLPQELTRLLERAGFRVWSVTNDLGRPLSMDDWSMQFVAISQAAK